MRAQNSVKCTSWLIALMALFSLTSLPAVVIEKALFEVTNFTDLQTAPHLLAHRGSGRIEFKVGQPA